MDIFEGQCFRLSMYSRGSIFAHELSLHYHDDIYDFLTDDIITIRGKYDVPVMLVGDFNSRVGVTSDFEKDYDHEGSFLENDPFYTYFQKCQLFNRENKDKHVNNNGKKLIELCKMSDLKIANGRVGADKCLGNYTCHTSRGNSTIDYAILSMDLFPYIADFYIDIYDKCMSDGHCPVCLIMSCKSDVSSENNSDQITKNEYIKTEYVKCKWIPDLSNKYTCII